MLHWVVSRVLQVSRLLEILDFWRVGKHSLALLWERTSARFFLLGLLAGGIGGKERLRVWLASADLLEQHARVFVDQNLEQALLQNLGPTKTGVQASYLEPPQDHSGFTKYLRGSEGVKMSALETGEVKSRWKISQHPKLEEGRVARQTAKGSLRLCTPRQQTCMGIWINDDLCWWWAARRGRLGEAREGKL
jgi:hypothetical protein